MKSIMNRIPDWRRRGEIEKRLERYAGSDQTSAGSRVELTRRLLPLGITLNKALSRWSFFQEAAALLAGADIKLAVGEYLLLLLITTIGSVSLVHWMFHFPAFTLLGGLVGFLAPQIYVRLTQYQRLNRFEGQLMDAIYLLVNGLRSGYSVLQAMEAIARDLLPPVSAEFDSVVKEVRLGFTLEQALANLLRRVWSNDLDMVVTAINVQREVGGNLAEILEVIGYTIRERLHRASAVMTIIKPMFLVFFLMMAIMATMEWAVFPSYFSLAWDTASGKTAMLFAYGLLSVGALVGTMIGQGVLDTFFELGLHRGIPKAYLALDLFLGGLILAVAAWLSAPSVVIIWLAVMLIYRAIVGFWRVGWAPVLVSSTVEAIPRLLVAGFRLVSMLLTCLPLVGLLLYFGYRVYTVLLWPIQWVVTGLLLLAVVLIIVIVLRTPNPEEALGARLAEYGARDVPSTLEEIEGTLPFSQRIVAPVFRNAAHFAASFTPLGALKSTHRQLELAGYPYNLTAWQFWAVHLAFTVLSGGLVGILTWVVRTEWIWNQRISLIAGAMALGYLAPPLWLASQVKRRQGSFRKALPDALDLLTVCVEAGLGFDAAMEKVTEKWRDDLAVAFGRALQEIRLGKLRRQALRDMADRMDVPDITSFVAAIIQADQLGVSIAKVLRIQSDRIRTQRGQEIQGRINDLDLQQNICLSILLGPSVVLWLIAPVIAQVMHSGL
jgi:tight adherence protein C